MFQVMVGLIIIFLSTIAHARFLPFQDPKMNTFEFISLFSSSLTFFLGAFTVEAGNRYTTIQVTPSIL